MRRRSILTLGAAVMAALAGAGTSGLLAPDATARLAQVVDQTTPGLLIASPHTEVIPMTHRSHRSHSSHRSHYSSARVSGGQLFVDDSADEAEPNA
jgi:hypothetical protein